MHKLAHSILLAALLGGCTASRISDPRKPDQQAVLATVQKFVTAFNAGDTPAAQAACTDELSIIDELPPYEWHGPGALAKWFGDYGVDPKRNGISDGQVTLGEPLHVDVSGEHAYTVIRSDYVYKRNGERVEQKGSLFTLALHRNADGWRVCGWSWARN